MPEGKGSQVTTTWILLLSVLQLTQSDSPPRLAPSRPRTFGVVSLLTNRRRAGGAVSGLLTLLVRFGESRPQPLVTASLIPRIAQWEEMKIFVSTEPSAFQTLS